MPMMSRDSRVEWLGEKGSTRCVLGFSIQSPSRFFFFFLFFNQINYSTRVRWTIYWSVFATLS